MDDRLVQPGEVKGDALVDVVASPVSVASAANGNVPLPGAAQGRQRLDGIGNLLRGVRLQDAEGPEKPGPSSVVGGHAVVVGVRGAGGKQEDVSKTSIKQSIALDVASVSFQNRKKSGKDSRP